MLTTPGYCDTHRAGVHRDYGRARRGFDTERGFYQSAAWRAVRAAFLRDHPLCVQCAARGRVVAAVVADHVVPIKDGGARFDTTNCQALCISHHNAKTASETARRSRVLLRGNEGGIGGMNLYSAASKIRARAQIFARAN